MATPLMGDTRAPIPIWAIRPGSVSCLRLASSGMVVWLLIRSSNGEEMTPCYWSELVMAVALGYVTRTPLRTRLEKLRTVPGLMLEIPLGRKRGSVTLLPSVRFATDPARQSYWFPTVTRRLRQVASEFGLGRPWVEDAQERLRKHASASNALLEALKEECFDADRLASSSGLSGVQDAGGGGRGGGSKSLKAVSVKRPRRKRRRRNKKGSRIEMRTGKSERATMTSGAGSHA
jgi:hypothetical protein